MFKKTLILLLTLLIGTALSNESGAFDVSDVSSAPVCPSRCRTFGSDGSLPSDCSPRCRRLQDTDVDFGGDQQGFQGGQDFVPSPLRYRRPYYPGPRGRPIYPPRPFYPGPGRRGRRRCSLTHVVREGDTCWNISQRFGLTVNQLEFLNPGLDCQQTIYPGQVFCVA